MSNNPTPDAGVADYAAMSDREIDAEVAVKVFGWRNVKPNHPSGNIPEGEPDDDYNRDVAENLANRSIPYRGEPAIPHRALVPNYASDPAASRLVVEEMVRREFYYSAHCDGMISPDEMYAVGFYKRGPRRESSVDRSLDRAICIACLMALDAEKEGKSNE